MGLTDQIAAKLRTVYQRSLYRPQHRRLAAEVDRLSIEEAGIADDGVPYVKLREGPIFYGYLSGAFQRAYYSLLSRETKSRLPFEVYNVAMDIVIRYQKGGLMLEGPRKQELYQVGRGDVCVEMGAYLGFYGMRLAGETGPEGRVIAIEPVTDNVRLLQRNVRENQLDHVTVVPKGVWNQPDRKRFTLAAAQMQSASVVLGDRNGEAVDVEVDCLDNLLGAVGCDEVDFMVIQLNGVELEALEGLTKVNVRNLAIAARYGSHGRAYPTSIAELLATRGYEVTVKQRDFVFGRAVETPEGKPT